MIIFEKIRWKNFLSCGNNFIEIQLNKNENTLIIGTNGAGKSTILDALCFGLFNKPFRKINKPQLVNSVNEKDSIVEIEFSKGNSNYKIVRGQKPNIFEIWKNGELLNQQSNSMDQQKYLEQNILKLNYKSFTQIVILGSSNFVPFMQLNPSHRRDVIEDLLDIKIFSSMNVVVKDNIRSCKEEIKILNQEKTNLDEKIEMQKNFIRSIEERNREEIKNKKNKINLFAKEALELISNNEESQNCLKEKQIELDNYSRSEFNTKKFNTIKGKIENKIENNSNNHKFFTENTVCPTCTQTIEENFRVSKIEELKTTIEELNSGLFDLEEKIKNEEQRENQFKLISKEVTKITNEISQNNTKIFSLQKQSKDLELEIKKLNNQIENKGIEHEKLDLIVEKSHENLEKLVGRKSDMENYEFVHSLLKDGGVKSKIVKKYIPIINNQINRYLQLMDFYINFNLDEEFKESVKSPIHEDFTYASFSEGEKMRIDLALLFTWREIAKIKNSTNTNLLIMDEVFDSSLDVNGTDEFMKIIRYIVKNTNTFVISHKSDLHDKFENVVKFDKIKGFSCITP